MNISWYDRLGIIILALLATWLMNVVIKTETIKTILEWLKSILIQIILTLRKVNSLIDSYTHDKRKVDKPKLLQAEDFKVFVFFSLLTAVTTRYLLSVFKHKVVGDGPFSNELIHILEVDVNDYIPSVTRN